MTYEQNIKTVKFTEHVWDNSMSLSKVKPSNISGWQKTNTHTLYVKIEISWLISPMIAMMTAICGKKIK